MIQDHPCAAQRSCHGGRGPAVNSLAPEGHAYPPCSPLPPPPPCPSTSACFSRTPTSCPFCPFVSLLFCFSSLLFLLLLLPLPSPAFGSPGGLLSVAFLPCFQLQLLPSLSDSLPTFPLLLVSASPTPAALSAFFLDVYAYVCICVLCPEAE